MKPNLKGKKKMNVWLMNLKDNRDNAEVDGTEKKFDICKSKGILGIGWVSDKSKEEEKNAYQNANSAIDDFEIGDLVWVRNTAAKDGEPNRYICKITATAVTTTDAELNSLDIGKFCQAEFHPVESIPDGISENALVSISTIRRANEDIANATVSFFKTLAPEKEVSDSTSIKSKTRIFAIMTLLCIFGLVALVIKGINLDKNAGHVTSSSSGISMNSESGVSSESTFSSDEAVKNSDEQNLHSSADENLNKKTFENFYSECKRLYKELGANDDIVQPSEDFGDNAYKFEIKNIAVVYVKIEDGHVKSLSAMSKDVNYYTQSVTAKAGALLCNVMAVPSFALTGDDMETMVSDILTEGKRNSAGLIEYETNSCEYVVSLTSGNVTTMFGVTLK